MAEDSKGTGDTTSPATPAHTDPQTAGDTASPASPPPTNTPSIDARPAAVADLPDNAASQHPRRVRLVDLAEEDRAALLAEARATVAKQSDELRAQGAPGGVTRLSAEMAGQPSDPPVYEVMVDTWGHSPTLIRGDVFEDGDVPYDIDFALRQGAIRQLTLAEARSAVGSTTQSLTVDSLAVDPVLQREGPRMAGITGYKPVAAVADGEEAPTEPAYAADLRAEGGPAAAGTGPRRIGRRR